MTVEAEEVASGPSLSRTPQVLLCYFGEWRLGDLRVWLQQANYRTIEYLLPEETVGSTPESSQISPISLLEQEQIDVVVIDASADSEKAALGFCQSIRRKLAERFIPIVLLTNETSPVIRAMSYNAGVDFHLAHPIESFELLAQLRSLLRMKHAYDFVSEKSATAFRSSRRLELAYQQIDQELKLAGRIQQSFLPRTLPDLPPARFAVKCQACGQVGGDFYEVLPLDDDMVGFYVADAMGHGVPASLLTIYVKKGIVTREKTATGYRLLSPGEVLASLNRDLLEQDLSENPFITMIYLILNLRTLELTWAKAGHPSPILIRPGNPPTYLHGDGPILGIMESDYEEQKTTLQPGDRVVVYTDGIDGVRYGEYRSGPDSFTACVVDHAGESIHELIRSVYNELFADRTLEDDITLLGLAIDSK